jgi:subtilisin family serine protease
MHGIVRGLTVAVVAAVTLALPAAVTESGAATGRYIVVLRGTAGSAAEVASEHGRRYGAQVSDVWESALKGYAATITSERVAAVRADPRVALVERDAPVQATQGGGTPSAQVLPWGINRIDADISSTLAGNGSGGVANVHVYVIDTGIAAHPDLNLVQFVNFAGGKATDCNGHGTHVAGTIAARDDTASVVGVVPGAPLHAVKVLNCAGSGTTAGVISGVNWVAANAQLPAVANLSLGGAASQALDDAVTALAAKGVTVAVAAGNDAVDACTQSPARAGAGTANGVITVAATDATDTEASFSNVGPCVDVWAPGVSVLSTWLRGATATLSGTSMASPHSAGTAALFLSSHTTATPSAVESALLADAASPTTLSKDGRAIKIVYAGRY